jgi:RNA polymerase sigma-32 factor
MAYIDTPQTQRANRSFIRAAMKVPLLEREHELDLARRWREKGDEAALHELVSAYMRLVISTAARFRNYGLPMGDLVQEGNVGLMLAAARFEPERQVRFSTYATWWIRSAIQEYVLRNWSVVRTGTTAAQKSLFFGLRRLRAQIAGDAAGGPLSVENREAIALRLKVKVRDVEAMEMRLSSNDKSLNAPIGENGDGEWLDLLADDRPGPEEVVLEMRDSECRAEWLARALTALTPREQRIIRDRRLREDSLTLETLGRALGISKERVRQIEHQALKKLKAAILREVGDPVLAGLTIS